MKGNKTKYNKLNKVPDLIKRNKKQIGKNLHFRLLSTTLPMEEDNVVAVTVIFRSIKMERMGNLEPWRVIGARDFSIWK